MWVSSISVPELSTDGPQGSLTVNFSCLNNKVEATSFTISEPVESLEISSILYSKATRWQREVIETKYEVKPFAIKTIKLERIFADKILAAEFYYQRRMLLDTAKHLYDLTTMMDQDRIQTLLSTPMDLIKVLAYKRREEREKIGSDLAGKLFSDFRLFEAVDTDNELSAAFSKMQDIYVLLKEDIVSQAQLSMRMRELNQTLLMLDENLEMT